MEFALYTVVATPRKVALLGAGRSWSDFTEHKRELLDALRSPLGRVWQHVAGAAKPVPRVNADVFAPLTPAERRVAELVLDGHRNHVVASLLGLSVKAVEQHLTRVYRKLDITSRSQLIAQAFGRTPLSIDTADRR